MTGLSAAQAQEPRDPRPGRPPELPAASAPAARGARRRPPPTRSSASGSSATRPCPPDTIAHYLGIKVGDPYDPEKIRQNFPTLWDVGPARERQDRGRALAGGRHPRRDDRGAARSSRRSTSSGNKKLSTSQIKDRLKEGKVEVHAGAPAVAARDREGALGHRRLLHGAGLPQRHGRLPDRRHLEDREEGRLPDRRGRQDQDRVHPVHGQHGRLGPDPSQRDDQDEGRDLVAAPLGQHDLQPGQLRGRRREHQGPLPVEGLQGRRRQGPDPGRLRHQPEGQAREDQAPGPHHDPDRRGGKVLHERDPHHAGPAERPAGRASGPDGVPGEGAAQAVRGAAAGFGLEPRPARRGAREHRERCTSRAATSTGSPTPSTRRSARTASTST